MCQNQTEGDHLAFNRTLEAIIVAYLTTEQPRNTAKWFLILLNAAAPETLDALTAQIRHDVTEALKGQS